MESRERRLVRWYLSLVLLHRLRFLVAITLITAILGYFALRVRIVTDFFDLYPPKHPYIQTYLKYRSMFGSANVLAVIVERTDGSIFNVDTFRKIDRITHFLLDSPGVDPQQVISLTHPRLKQVAVSGWGVAVRPVMAAGLPKTQEQADRIRETTYANPGIRGFYVSPDETAAAIFAGFWEEGTDLSKIFGRMQAMQAQETDERHRIYITGFPMLFAWVNSYFPATLVVMAITGLVITLLLWFYFRTLTGVWVSLFSGLLSSLWAVGFAGLFGFNLDPLALVVFVLITARALSHSVQSMERFHDEYRACGNKQEAIHASYTALFAPAAVSIAADGLAILTLVTAAIGLIQKIALVASFWIFTITISVITLHPIILSFLPPPKHDPKAGRRFSDFVYDSINHGLVRLSSGKMRWGVVAAFAVFLTAGLYYGHFLKVGDVTVGKALLYADHPYNQAFDFLNSKFVGSASFSVVADGNQPRAIDKREVLTTFEHFQRVMEEDPDAGGSTSVADLVKRIQRMFQEGEPLWEMIPSNSDHASQFFHIIAGGSTKGELDRLFSPDYSRSTITVFYRDYSNDTVKRAIARAKQFIEKLEGGGLEFHLAGGLIAILAAINEEVEWSYSFNLYLVLVTVFVLSLITYRSLAGALIVILPSIVAQPLTEAIMYLSGIDMNINSLPVAAIGIGIGIDYGYYVLSRIIEELEETRDFDAANRRALMTTGRAILFTGTTLTVSVIFWVWFPMRFQAEMAYLLSIVLALHVLGALVLIPTMVSLWKPRFAWKGIVGKAEFGLPIQAEGEGHA